MSQVITQTETNDKTLLTYSALNTFRNCPRKYKNRYIDNLRPRERAEALSFGSVIHAAIELWYRSPDTESRLPDVLAYIDDAFENRVVDSNQMVQWHLATAMIRGYAERYATEEFEIVEVEKEFVGEIRNPDTGRQSQTFRIAGKVDEGSSSEDPGPRPPWWPEDWPWPPPPDEPVVIEAPPPLPNIIWPRLPPDHPYHLPPGYHYPDNLPEGHPGHYYPGMPPYPVIAP